MLTSVGCRAVKLDMDKIEELMASVPAWQLADSRDMLTRKLVAKNFKAGKSLFTLVALPAHWALTAGFEGAAIDCINKVAVIAEAEGHHPDLHLTDYRNVEVNMSTHALKGISMFDFIVAAKIDSIEVEYSPKWLRQQQQQQGSAAQCEGNSQAAPQ
jgi:4a-hydroxytetrahydrobiopterin dehydratase